MLGNRLLFIALRDSKMRKILNPLAFRAQPEFDDPFYPGNVHSMLYPLLVHPRFCILSHSLG